MGSAKRYAFKKIKYVNDGRPTLFSMLRKDNSLELPPSLPLTDTMLWEAMDKRQKFSINRNVPNIKGNPNLLSPAPKDPYSQGLASHSHIKKQVVRDVEPFSPNIASKIRG